jgi:hypothetical protein
MEKEEIPPSRMLLICEWKLYARTSSYTTSALPLPVLPLKTVPVAGFLESGSRLSRFVERGPEAMIKSGGIRRVLGQNFL